MAVAPPSLPPKSPRYVFLDAWRAIAALGVMIHHMINNSVMTETLRKVLPAPLLFLDGIASYRIPLFIIISGFVIAHSMRKNPLTPNAVGNFVLRRHLRLDPVYWVMIILVILITQSERFFPSLVAEPMPSPKTIFLNFFYLQYVLQDRGIVIVAWTLCLEFQFYLVYLLILLMGKYLSKGRVGDDFRLYPLLLVFAVGCCSLVWVHFATGRVWFIQYWQYFALGTLCWAAIHYRQFRGMFFCFLGLSAVSMMFLPMSPLMPRLLVGDLNNTAPAMLIGILLSTFIYLVGIRGRLVDMWNWKPIQYVATISYSLYLVHFSILEIVLRGGYKLTGPNPFFAVFWFLLTGAICIGVAHVFYLMFERPSMKYAATFKARSQGQIPLPPSPTETASAA